jgi:ACT domain-containing protein
MSDAHDPVHVRQDHRPSWRREIAELAALFVAVGLAHLLATLLGHRDPGPIVLIGLGLALIGGAALHKRLAAGRRLGRRADRAPGGASPVQGDRAMALWRIRTRVVERPGRLAEVAGAFARLRCNILALHIATTGGSAISPAGCDALDEFVVEAPADLTARDLSSAVDAAGGLDIVIVPAEIHDLVDPAVQALHLAHLVCDDPGRLPEAMSDLLRAPQVEWRRPGDTVDETGEPNTTMVVSVHPEGALLLRRPDLPFSPTEAARAAALAAAARRRRYAG